jgi:hypothetical protein
MDTLTKHRKTVRPVFDRQLIGKKVFEISTNLSQTIIAMTKGWQCCKCKEEMYRDENNCNWDRCNHRRCSSCRSFQV